MMKRCLLVLALWTVGLAHAQDTLTAYKVTAFKNGVGFVAAKGLVHAVGGECTLVPPPPALFGALWFEGALRHVYRVQDTLTTLVTAEALPDLFRANLGHRAEVTLKDETAVDAVIVHVGIDFVVLKTNVRWTTLRFDQIIQSDFYDTPAFKYPRKDLRPAVRVVFQNQAPRQLLQVYYLQRGLSWQPQYRLELQSGQKARLTLQACLVNDALDLHDAEVQFAVGSPEFAFAFVDDPLVSEHSFLETMRSLQYPAGVNTPVQRYDNVMSGGHIETSWSDAAQGDSPTEDVFLYKQEHVTLAQGGRATYPLFQSNLSYEDLYVVELEANASSNYSSSRTDAPAWHAARLRNKSNEPWTTGSVMLFKARRGGDEDAGGQSLMRYTPPGETALVRLAGAPYIHVQTSEGEVDRKEHPKGRDNGTHIIVESKIVLRNDRPEASMVLVKRRVTGDIVFSTVEYKAQKSLEFAGAVNPQNEVAWELTLPPNGEETITYSYKYLLTDR